MAVLDSLLPSTDKPKVKRSDVLKAEKALRETIVRTCRGIDKEVLKNYPITYRVIYPVKRRQQSVVVQDLGQQS